MSDWLKRERIPAECGFCWTDDTNAECPEHGHDAMRDAALTHFKALSENLAADNARLRALVKAGERGTAAYVACPWCEWQDGAHAPDCAAFTPNGVVK